MKDLWAAEWHSNCQLDGDKRHIIYENYLPKLFKTRAEARLFIKAKYAYIAQRKDLREEPHGWRIPQAVKVTIQKVSG